MDKKQRRVFSVAPGSRIKHLKKPDGEPLWRSDIQYDFLHAIFHNPSAVFTNFYTKEPNKTFSEIYVDSMARSSKCSKILGERLLSGGLAPLNIAMVCILVNIGRMNTTLNFFPEMKAQLRTYHPIPSLQSNDQLQDKQLQDAPRLKSILKGACEDDDAPQNLQQLEERPHGARTNPINLIFILTNHFAEVEEKFFNEPFQFSDLIMSPHYGSQSRAQAFLWLCWTYLESDWTPESISRNPFGDGTARAPALKLLSEPEVKLENVDPTSEVNYGNQMLQKRIKYLESGTTQAKARALVPAVKHHHISLPIATSARDRRIMYEYSKLIHQGRLRERRHRHRGSSLARQWQSMKDTDPVYTSDDETVATTGPPSAGLKQYGFNNSNKGGDFGEFFATMSKVFKTLNQASVVVPPVVEPLGYEDRSD